MLRVKSCGKNNSEKENQIWTLLIITHIISCKGPQFPYIYIMKLWVLIWHDVGNDKQHLDLIFFQNYFSGMILHVGFFWNINILFIIVSRIKISERFKVNFVTWNCLLHFIRVMFGNYYDGILNLRCNLPKYKIRQQQYHKI